MKPFSTVKGTVDVMNLDKPNVYRQMEKRFLQHADSHWAHFSRFNNLLIILNISLFFLTDLVTKQGYYYTFYSLFFLALVAVGQLLPFGLLNRLWYYLTFISCEMLGVYFLVASVRYWIGSYRG